MPDRLRSKHNALVVIVNSILNNEKVRRFDPISFEMLDEEMRRYREIEEIVAQEMAQ